MAAAESAVPPLAAAPPASGRAADGTAPGAYEPTNRTVPTRDRERASYDRDLVHSLLDQSYVCHLGFIRDGAPVVLPTLYARVGERLYVHGSTGSRPLRMAGAATPAPATDEGTAPAPDVDEGTTPTATAGESAQRPASVTGESSNSPAATASPSAPLAGPGTDPAPTAPPTDGAIPKDRQAEQQPGLSVCLTVTHLDGVVLARSAFHHSINYRSVVVHGIARQVTDPAERTAALDALVNHVVPGRAADCRPANARELAATAVLRLDLAEVSAKWREGGPNDEPEDLELPHWAGVLPVARHYGTPLPSDDLASGIPAPDYLPGH